MPRFGSARRCGRGRLLRRIFGTDDAAGAALVLDDDRLAERFGKPRLDGPRDEVEIAAGRERDDDADRLRRIVLRLRERAQAGPLSRSSRLYISAPAIASRESVASRPFLSNKSPP